jgi:response regulator RpfG family c-di-GMP phosphodiesterase
LDDTPEHQAHPLSHAGAAGGAPRILVVDDEPNICALFEQLFGGDDYEIDTCLTGRDAMEKIQAAEYDMVVSDLKMPGISGIDLIKAVKEQHPDTATVLITGYATVDTAVDAMRHGADDYLKKPFKIEELRQVINSGLETKHLRSTNRDLVGMLKATNAELQRHKDELKHEVVRTSESLLSTNHRLEQRVQQLKTIMKLTEAITSILDLDRLLDFCLRLLGREMNVENSSLMLTQPDGDTLVVKAGYGPRAEKVMGQERELGDGVAGWVAEYKEPLLITDVERSPIFATEFAESYEGKSFLSVPLVLQERTLGALNLTGKTGGEPFTESDREFVLAIAGQIAVAIENAGLYDTIRRNSLSAVQALAESLEARDPYTSGHSTRVTDYAVRVAKALGVSRSSIDTLRCACRLHDIGKLGISEAILHKNGPLSEDEWAMIQEHPGRGERIIHSLGFLGRAKPVVRHHHERWDGGGYPDGLRSQEIPFLTRILSVADCYDAMTSQRPYRSAMSRFEALAELDSGKARQFDPAVVEQFARVIEGGPVVHPSP